MGIRSKLEKAETRAALEGLALEQERIQAIGEVFSETYSIDSILTRGESGNLFAVLPINSSKLSDLEMSFLDGAIKSLRGHGPRLTNFGDYVALELTKAKKGRKPKSLGIEAEGINFMLNLIRRDISFNGVSPQGPRNIPLTGETYAPRIKTGESFDVEVGTDSSVKYGLIPLSTETRPFFPGFKVPFTIVHGRDSIETHVTSAPKGTEVGSLAGVYISRNVGRFYEEHPRLKEANRFTFKVEKKGEDSVYRITRASK